MTKSLDGIKKLSPEEAKKYRRIVLDYIGDKDPAGEEGRKKISQARQAGRPLDGIRLNNEKSAARSRRQAEKEKKEREQALRLEELKKKEIVLRTERRAEEKKRAAQDKARREKTRLEQEAEEIARRAREARRLEEMKRREEIKGIKLAERRKRKERRRRALTGFRKKISLELSGAFSAVKRNYFQIIFVFLFSLFAFYAVFCVAVLRLRFDNIIIRQALDYLPVPAVITSRGIIGYTDFKNLENESYLSLDPDGRKYYLAEWVITRDLKRRYGFADGAAVDDLAARYALDSDFNLAGLSRINKIRQLLRDGEEIEKLAKYADEYNDAVYYDSDLEAAREFGPTVRDLGVGQTSGLILHSNGYYIIKRISAGANRFGLKYIFVKGQTLEQYIGRELARTNVFILANQDLSE